MTRRTASVAVGAFALLAQAAAAGKAYDDREVMKRTAELAEALVRAVPGPTACDSRAGDFKKDPIKSDLAELGSIGRTLRSASRRGGPEEMRKLRAAVAGKIPALTAKISSYGASATSYASLGKQIKTHQKTKPNC